MTFRFRVQASFSSAANAAGPVTESFCAENPGGRNPSNNIPTTGKAHKRKAARLIQAICLAFQVSSNRITENISPFPRSGVKANGSTRLEAMEFWRNGVVEWGRGGVGKGALDHLSNTPLLLYSITPILHHSAASLALRGGV